MPKLYPQYVTVALTFAEVAVDIVIPISLLASTTLLAGDYYLALDGAGGLDPETDQKTAGGILWILGDLALIPFLVLSLRQLRRRDDEQAVQEDRELDAVDAAAAGDGPPDPSATGRPWWEDGVDVATHFRWKQGGDTSGDGGQPPRVWAAMTTTSSSKPTRIHHGHGPVTLVPQVRGPAATCGTPLPMAAARRSRWLRRAGRPFQMGVGRSTWWAGSHWMVACSMAYSSASSVATRSRTSW